MKINENIDDVLEDEDELYKKVSQNVKKLRKAHHMSQLKFSENIGFNSVSFYCDCENNKNGKHFNLLHVVRISKYLDIDINTIVN